MFVDPAACGQFFALAGADSALAGRIEVFQTGAGLAQTSILEPSSEATIVAIQVLGFDEQAKALVEVVGL